jgi:hypothetical protein
MDAAVPLFRRTFPLENLANYVAECNDGSAVVKNPLA